MPNENQLIKKIMEIIKAIPKTSCSLCHQQHSSLILLDIHSTRQFITATAASNNLPHLIHAVALLIKLEDKDIFPNGAKEFRGDLGPDSRKGREKQTGKVPKRSARSPIIKHSLQILLDIHSTRRFITATASPNNLPHLMHAVALLIKRTNSHVAQNSRHTQPFYYRPGPESSLGNDNPHCKRLARICTIILTRNGNGNFTRRYLM
ncbi:hypothetical protein CDAR_443201 [Caerostris darwini]|uniref:Uncharacterized protein n=1 Tax=Caerostris darwini TaxID=1538125 RepID=A0AAV4MIY0_9ARAC|nr:hypothetical protein CDAR_443201 [Caerostris darwini]